MDAEKVLLAGSEQPAVPKGPVNHPNREPLFWDAESKGG